MRSAIKWLGDRRSQAEPSSRPAAPDRNITFVFVSGASGSGTTLLTRILSQASAAVALGGNFVSLPRPDRAIRRELLRLDRATADLWDRQGTYPARAEAQRRIPLIVGRLLSRPDLDQTTHVIYKRSAPFFKGNRYRPDLWDLSELFEHPRILIMYRQPQAAVFSSLRRGFSKNLLQAAKTCEEQLTYLSAQLGALRPDRYQVLHYEALCENPTALAGQLAEYCSLPPDELRRAMLAEEITAGRNQRWKSELAAADVAFLESFFDRRRLAQWPRLRTAQGAS